MRTSNSAASASTTASYRSSGRGVAIDLNSGECFGGDAQGDRLYSIEGAFGTGYTDHLHGSDERNVLRGEAGADYLVGYGGNDLLAGGGGNDLLRSGMGADELRGDAGTDYALYSGSGQAVTVDLAAGKGFGGEAEGDRLSASKGCWDRAWATASRATPPPTSFSAPTAPISSQAGAAPTDSSTPAPGQLCRDVGSDPRFQPQPGRQDRGRPHGRQ